VDAPRCLAEPYALFIDQARCELALRHVSGHRGRCSKGRDMNDDLHPQLVYEANRKSVGLTYVLWFFFGWLGLHRFYAGATKSGAIQLVLAISIIGWLVLLPWLLADLFLIPGLVREKNMETINEITFGHPEGPVEPERRVQSEADRKREQMLEDLRSTGYRKDRREEISRLYR
jgi:TM2 domain-containing membrane protein YozV